MFSLKRPKGTAVLVADIDDMSVGVSVVHLGSDGPVTIVASERRRLPFESRTKEQTIVGVGKLLEEVTNSVVKTYTGADAKNAPPPLKRAYAILHAPWSKFRTETASEQFEAPRPITKELIAATAKKALATPRDVDKGTILESGIMQVTLSGYPTGKPVGKRSADLSVTAFESDIDPGLKQTVITTLGKVLPGRDVSLRSSMRAALSVLHEHLPDIHRYVILDVGGEGSDCAIIRKESVTQLARVGEGTTSIIKRLAGAGLPEEIFTQMRMLAMDTCATDACKALKDSLARIEPDLAKIFGEKFSSLAAKRRLPNSAILNCPPEFSLWLQGFFSRIDFSQFTATLQPFTVEPLSPDHLRDIVIWSAGIPADTGLGLAAGYVHILEETA